MPNHNHVCVLRAYRDQTRITIVSESIYAYPNKVCGRFEDTLNSTKSMSKNRNKCAINRVYTF